GRRYTTRQAAKGGTPPPASSAARGGGFPAVPPAAHAIPPGLTPVPDAQPKQTGFSSPNAISPELVLIERARGSMELENGTVALPFYGYAGDGPMVPAPGDTQAPGHNVEATKTDPDENTYLVLK